MTIAIIYVLIGVIALAAIWFFIIRRSRGRSQRTSRLIIVRIGLLGVLLVLTIVGLVLKH